MSATWSTDEVLAEMTDQIETLDSLLGKTESGYRGKMPVGHLSIRRAAAAGQLSRGQEAYGLDLNRWPAGSLHAMRSTEREIADLDARVAAVIENVLEYLAELRRRA